MNPSFLPLIALWLILLVTMQNRRKNAITRKIIEKRKSGENKEMKELALTFLNKECIIDSFDGNHQYQGLIKEVTDGAILVERNGRMEALNLDFVIRIREYPRKKK